MNPAISQPCDDKQGGEGSPFSHLNPAWGAKMIFNQQKGEEVGVL